MMKRILAGVTAALLAFSANAASLYPLGLMNPVGSTSGQVIVSTGPTTAPTWSTIGALGYATLASPAFTGIPTAPTAALNTTTTQLATTAYVVNQGYLTINLATSTYAPLASPTFTGSPVVPGYLTTASATSTYAPLASPTGTGTATWPTFKATAHAELTYTNTSGLSIPSSVLTTITTWTSAFDLNSNFNASTGTFTAPATARYQVSGHLVYNVSSGVLNNQFQVLVVSNAITVYTGYNVIAGAVTQADVPFSLTVSLTAGQTLLVKAFQNNAAAQTLNTGVGSCVLSIVQLP